LKALQDKTVVIVCSQINQKLNALCYTCSSMHASQRTTSYSTNYTCLSPGRWLAQL